MNTVNTVTQMLDAMELFVAEGRKVDASDLCFADKLSKLESLGETYGLA
jgi:hypothetical protein